jgi:hypothetical protein
VAQEEADIGGVEDAEERATVTGTGTAAAKATVRRGERKKMKQ